MTTPGQKNSFTAAYFNSVYFTGSRFCGLLNKHFWVVFLCPRSEHAKRSPNCGFLTMKKDFTELTVGEFYLLEQERLKVFHVSDVCAD